MNCDLVSCVASDGGNVPDLIWTGAAGRADDLANRAAGAVLARRKVRQSTGTGKTYYGAEKGKHRASLPGQPPASWTGQLANSISTRETAT
jgi:hypothetical protein